MKTDKFFRFLSNRDLFGHSFQLLYKGDEAYNTVIGGILTLMVQLLTLVMAIRAYEEVVMMNDPRIINYTKPVGSEEISDLLPLKFDDSDFVIAFKASVTNKRTSQPTELPPTLGTLRASLLDW